MGSNINERVCLRPCGEIPEKCLCTNATCDLGSCEYGYGNFTPWSNCSCQCQPGVETRNGTCIFLANMTASSLCDQDMIVETRPCNTDACERFSAWSHSSVCSVECGTGIRNQTRICMDSQPPVSPEYCTNRVVACVKEACSNATTVTTATTATTPTETSPTMETTPPTTASVATETTATMETTPPTTASVATETTATMETTPPTTASVATETTPTMETTPPTTASVPVYGNFTEWTNCSCICRPGTQNRTGICIFQDTLQAATGCTSGNTITETRSCSNDTCNVYTIWTPSLTCNESTGMGEFNRTCVEFAGSGTPSTLPASCLSQPRACSSDRIGYGNFTEYTTCNETCFPGYQSRTGICLFLGNRSAATGCDPALAVEIQQCNTVSCNAYSPWINGSCSVACGDGSFLRTRSCMTFSAGSTVLPTSCTSLNLSCSGPPCQQYTEFSNFTACNTTCVTGKQSRTRECRNVMTNLAATGCGGPDVETEFRDCNTDLCSSYGAYVNGTCTRDCMGEAIRSIRTCNDNGTIPTGCNIILYNCTTPLPSDTVRDILFVIDDTGTLDDCGTSLVGFTPAGRIEPLKNATRYPRFNQQREFIRNFVCRYKEVGLGTDQTQISIMSHQGNCQIFNNFNEDTLTTIDNMPAFCGAVDISQVGPCFNSAFNSAATVTNPNRENVNNTVIFITPDLSTVPKSIIGGQSKTRNLNVNLEYLYLVSAVTEAQAVNSPRHFEQTSRWACFTNPPTTADCENYLGTIYDSMDHIFARMSNGTRLFEIDATGQAL